MTQTALSIHLQADTARWWESFYDEAAMMVLDDQKASEINQQVDLITDLCGISPGDSVMDQCCGLGQHAVVFASRGFNVTGIDQSERYIESSRHRANDADVSAEFIRADALRFVLASKVDAVVNWHSSYGYLPCDRDNEKMLRCAFESLRPTGSMLLEYPNMLHLIANFKPAIKTELADNVHLTRTCRIEPCDGTIRQTWTYWFPNGTQRQHKSLLRVYLPNQLVEQFQRIGFAKVELFSGDGKQLKPEDSRCIVLARR